MYVCRKEPLIRQIPTTDVMEPLSLDPPLRVLAMVAAPSDLPAIDPVPSGCASRRRSGPYRPRPDPRRVARRRDLGQRAREAVSAPWHVLHFVGHGSYDSSSDEGVLAFVGPDGRAEYVDASALADLLDQAEPIPGWS